MSHTPGPWVAFYKHKYNEWHVSLPRQKTNWRLDLFPDGVVTENPEADAKLIAAAPELLAACKAARRVMAGIAGITREEEQTVERLDMAITKAEGEQT